MKLMGLRLTGLAFCEILYVILFRTSEVKNNGTRNQHVHQCQENQALPTQVHQLVITESWNGPTDKHEEQNKKDGFGKQYHDTDQRKEER